MDLASSYNFNPYHMNGMSSMGMNMGFMMNHGQYAAKELQGGMGALPPRGIVDYYHSCKSKSAPAGHLQTFLFPTQSRYAFRCGLYVIRLLRCL